jgi:hypothetical protein
MKFKIQRLLTVLSIILMLNFFVFVIPSYSTCETSAVGEPYDREINRTEVISWMYQEPISDSPGYCYLISMTRFKITYDRFQGYQEVCCCDVTNMCELGPAYEKVIEHNLVKYEVVERSRKRVECCDGTPPDCPIGSNGAPQPQNPHITSGSLCRGACGADCPSTCTSLPDITICVPDSTGKCHYICTYTGMISCGSHAGCREHDACYDNCATNPHPALCRRGCDWTCIRNYNTSTCRSWMNGGGPFDSFITYSNPPTLTGPFPGPCTVPG